MKFVLVGVNATYNHTNLAIRSIAKYVESEIEHLNIDDSDNLTEFNKSDDSYDLIELIKSDDSNNLIEHLNIDDSNNLIENLNIDNYNNLNEKITILTKEFTINDSLKDNVLELLLEDAQIYGFSAYIWNIQIILEMTEILKKLKPECTILIGGPEISFENDSFFDLNPQIDYLIQGPGEKACFEFVMACFYNKYRKISKNQSINQSKSDILERKIIEGEALDLDKIPFAYGFESITYKTKHIYYETTRGCPYNCSYCLSSTIKSMNILPINRVNEEMKFFTSQNSRQIKLVDRTFNFDDKRAIEIWEFLINQYNESPFDTNFHFEIAADLLTESSIEVLSRAPKGIFQFEIGVQTTNEDVLRNVNRKFSLEKLYSNVRKIKNFGNINLHLDLIAGLPGENITSFSKSFHDVIALEPDMLQLGFLKVLKGSPVRDEAKTYGLIYSNTPPYEILQTSDMPFVDLLRLKRIEKILDRYYNSSLFKHSMKFLMGHFENYFEFFEMMENAWSLKGNFQRNLSRQDIILELYNFGVTYFGKVYKENLQIMSEVFRDLLKFDYYFYDKKGSIPELLFNFGNHHPMCDRKYEKESWYMPNGQPICKKPRIEMYSFDVKKLLETGGIIIKRSFVLYEMHGELPYIFDILTI